jgi:mersacidin/lichenicidin family type 2 lantibiotic
MTKLNVIRAWRDKEYRESLNQQELATLPAHPAGLIELPDEVLNSAAGGTSIIVKTRDNLHTKLSHSHLRIDLRAGGHMQDQKMLNFQPFNIPGRSGLLVLPALVRIVR